MNTLPRLTSSEIGVIWAAYQEATMTTCFLKYFIRTVDDSETNILLKECLKKEELFIEKLVHVMKQDNMPVPVAFSDSDVNLEAPRLFSDEFVLFYKMGLAKIGLIKDSTSLSLLSRVDLLKLFKARLDECYETYETTTILLLKRGLYVRPPYLYPPEVEFVKGSGYLGGTLFGKRPLNVMEVAHLVMNNNYNLIGLMLCTGFSQVAENKDVVKHMVKGKEITKEIMAICSDFLMESDVQAPSTWDAEVTSSTVAPFSDRLMLFYIAMLSEVGSNIYSISSAASLRTDLQVAYAKVSQDVASFTKNGVELMIKFHWLEQPPTFPDRNKLAKK
ncbi:DUF3231 family protein [Bacillus sp. FJAT-45066]|uniref:DUF3231 family protein n=1 Tax=Bacillus sp. FJAT-45066 TaxID=2011010 RepID=UPI000BB72DC8|nr:DUF3231 family protein [Bacillus sp. FJAT-45066]